MLPLPLAGEGRGEGAAAVSDQQSHAIEYPVFLPALHAGQDPARHPVLIAGGGPVGLALALALSRHGVRSVVIEADRTVCVGSRAICLSRRTLEILDRLGALAPFLERGLGWTSGRSFYRGQEVLRFAMPHDADQRLPPMLNLQQYYVEQFLLEEAQRHPGLIEIRWGTRLTGLQQDLDGVQATLDADGTEYAADAEWLAACDGARSTVRQALGLRMAGTAYQGRYVIVDIQADIALPTERLAWFDPPSNPGRTMLMHKQPDGIWRLDYQLRDDEDAERAVQPEQVRPVVAAHLAMMGVTAPWTLVWSSIYRASALSVAGYRQGRVLLAGDAAHLVPIFGVRGLNSGFEDAFNLGWKLAAVLGGTAPEALLDSYDSERRGAWRRNVANAMKSTEFMAPPSRGYALMRDAVLSLAGRHPALRSLINPRQADAGRYDDSPLNTPAPGAAAGPAMGGVLPECPLQRPDGAPVFLTALLPRGFTLLRYDAGGAAVPQGHPVPVGELRIASGTARKGEFRDAEGRFRAVYHAVPGQVWLVRPDGHLCAQRHALDAGWLHDALLRATGR